MNWPNGSDGDVFRSLDKQNFNFDLAYDVDFDIDFSSWPPNKQVIEALKHKYKFVKLFEPDDDSEGYISIQINSKLSYEFVIETQKNITDMVVKSNGVCEAWGILHG